MSGAGQTPSAQGKLGRVVGMQDVASAGPGGIPAWPRTCSVSGNQGLHCQPWSPHLVSWACLPHGAVLRAWEIKCFEKP